jgi:putative N6-adenine-specific DNA methylase
VDFFATAAKGTETALRDELLELAFTSVRADRGGVHFAGPRREAYRACLWSRIAVRILEPLGSFPCPDEDALYAGVSACDFSEILSPRQTLAVSAACRSSRLTHTQYIAQRTKDAIVDGQRERHGERPDVDRDDPDLHVFVHLVRDQATVYLDHAGAPLHLRGYRLRAGEAPLKENLAAAVLKLSGFDPEQAVLDPMCGSGTLLLEAALWATRRAPGLLRERFGFERWASFDASEQQAMAELRGAARAAILPHSPAMLGSDVLPEALVIARENAQRAGVELTLSEGATSRVRPTFERGLLVANPPYGERLERSPELPRELSRMIDRFPDWHAGLLMAEDQPLGRTRRKPRLYSLYNGDIACSLRTYSPIVRRGADEDSEL